jgi:hypothetical protein
MIAAGILPNADTEVFDSRGSPRKNRSAAGYRRASFSIAHISRKEHYFREPRAFGRAFYILQAPWFCVTV